MSMTISLALRKIKDLKGKIEETDGRLKQSTVWDEATPPVWKYEDLYLKKKGLVEELVALKSSVAFTNANTPLEFEGRIISLALGVILLSEIKGQIALMKGLPTCTDTKKVDRTVTWEPDEHDYSKRNKVETVTTTMCALTTAKKATEVDELKEQFQKLNDAVEMANSRTVLQPDYQSAPSGAGK